MNKKTTKIVASLMLSTTLLSVHPMPVLADAVSSNVNTEQTSSLNTDGTTSITANENSVKDNNGESVQKHELTKPYVVYGAGLSQSEQQQIGQTLGVTDSFETLTATANDYREFIDAQSSATTDASMISSVALEPTDPNSGVKVNIKTFDGENNITQVTAQQYAMVATLAGVKDMNIIVTANRPVSGTSALTGVYVALQKDGIELNSQNTAVANDMLGATQQAIEQNDSDPKYAGQLSNAVMNTASEVAQNKQNGNTMDNAKIQAYFIKQLEKQGIKDKTPVSTVNNITNIIGNKFQNAPVANTKTFVNNAKNTVSNISENIKNGGKNMFNMDEFKDKLPSENWFVQKWHAFVNWLKGLFGGNDNQSSETDTQKAKKTNNDNQNVESTKNSSIEKQTNNESSSQEESSIKENITSDNSSQSSTADAVSTDKNE